MGIGWYFNNVMLSYQYMSYYCGLVYRIDIILRRIQGDVFTVLYFVRRIVWDCSVFNKLIYYHDFFCLEPELHLCDPPYHWWVLYIDTKTNTVLRFVWNRLVFIQYSYYRDLFCSGPESRLWNSHCHVWVRNIYTTKITVACMSLLILSIDIWRFYYFIMFYFKLTNGAMVKWWMVKWCDVEINNIIGRFLSQK